MNLAIILAICTAIGVAAGSSAANTTGLYDTKQVICAVKTKSLYDSENSWFDIENVDLELCTILVIVDDYWQKAQEPFDGKNPHQETDYEQLTGLRTKYPHLKVLLGIRRSSRDYLKIAKNATKREEFAKNVADFIVRHRIDGLDLRWVYSAGENTNFISTYLSLLKEVNKKLKESQLLFTTSYEVGLKSDLKEEDFPNISMYCDFVTIFHSYLSVTNENEAIINRDISYIQEYFANIVRLGTPSMKIVIGVQLDSPKFVKNIDSNDSKFEQNVDYNTACDLLSNEHERDWEKTFNSEAGLAVVTKYDRELNIKYSIVLESSRAIANKLRFGLKSIHLSGVMIHTLDMDDIRGMCGFEEDTWEDFKPIEGVKLKFPERQETFFTLLRTINETIAVVFDEIEQENNPSHSSRNAITIAPVLIIGILAYLLL